MYDVKRKLQQVLSRLPQGVRLVAISKYHPNEYIEAAYEEGQRVFGESHEQELRQKHETLPNDIVWHFIGHLQTNKVKYIAPFVYMIHSVDSEKLLAEINKHAAKHSRTIKCLLQLKVAEEETKTGFTSDEIIQLFETKAFDQYPNVSINGLMTVATNTDNEEQIDKEFNQVAQLFTSIKATYNPPAFTEISMGMTDYYPIAIKNHSTIIRIGSAIFGERDYSKKL